MRVALGLLLVMQLSACWPGRCDGGLRALVPLPFKGQPMAELVRDHVAVGINLDTNLKTGSQILAASGLDATSVLLVGPTGNVPLTIDASVNSSAHSCASAGSFHATATTSVAPGEYAFVVLLDKVTWKPIDDDDVTTWRGQRAMVRTYRVK